MNVVLVLRTGGDFNFQDVDLLATHLHKTWKGSSKLNIYCLYDGVQTSYDMIHYTLLPMEVNWKGWWSKLNLYSSSLSYLRPFLFLDLDTAVLRDWSEDIIPQNALQSFIAIEDFYKPGVGNTGVLWIPNDNKINTVFNVFAKDSDLYIKANSRGDASFVNKVIRPDLLFQSFTKSFTTFKPLRKGWLTEVPKEVSFVCFHGQPRIFEAAKKVQWVNNYIHKQSYEENVE